MGREALCECTFEGTTANVKALLESNEIILRGDIRMSVPLDALKNLRVESESLCFNLGKRPMRLHLGAKAAESWARKIKTQTAHARRQAGNHRQNRAHHWQCRGSGPLRRAVLSRIRSSSKARPHRLLHRHAGSPRRNPAGSKGTTRQSHPHLAHLPQRPRTPSQRVRHPHNPPRQGSHGHEGSLRQLRTDRSPLQSSKIGRLKCAIVRMFTPWSTSSYSTRQSS
jgi:hypothetical protein